MTQTTDEAIAILQAAKEGKIIQWQRKGVIGSVWYTVSGDAWHWNFADNAYRVKPEPVKLDLWHHPNPPVGWRRTYDFATSVKPRMFLDRGYRRISVVEKIND